MTHLERFWATVAGERPDQVLYTADFTPDLRRRLIEPAGTEDLAKHYGFFAPAGTGPKPPASYKAPDYSAYYATEKLPEGTTINGDGVAMIPANYFHFWGYRSPLRNAVTFDQIESYPFTDQADWATDHMAADVEKAHAAGNVAVVWAGHMYETAWQIRGYEQFLIDMIERPDWAEAMLDKTHRRAMTRAVAAARAGADLIMCGDDVASQKSMMFSLPMWRSFMLSRWQKVWSAVRAITSKSQIWYHSDGNIEAIVPELMDAGVNILNPVQPECIGKNGSRPSHPELLDWLACEFRDSGGSFKKLHRAIVLSAAYRQGSRHDPEAAKRDADNRLLWRMNRQRLDAEALRDSVLAVSGKLDLTMHGPGFELFRFKDDHSPIYDHLDLTRINAPDTWRRTVYRFVVRSVPNPFLDSLDCADPNINVPVRNTTMTALQALALLNNPFMVKQSEFFAERVAKMENDPQRQVDAAYRLALGRPPDADERTAMTAYVRRHGLANGCRFLFNTNEFLFLD